MWCYKSAGLSFLYWKPVNTFLQYRGFIFLTGILLSARSRQNMYKVTLSKSFFFKDQITED